MSNTGFALFCFVEFAMLFPAFSLVSSPTKNSFKKEIHWKIFSYALALPFSIGLTLLWLEVTIFIFNNF